ncbi:MAG: Phosphodiesterase [Methanosaeta sp. PtaB.Bin039]|nr:MAG: Phosphodiesterase [Methanosaeta sp. PtaB.Bin039]OPY44073.1 MAG: Phosphodiesterase [Methanosaeta sp. PtaU1.Bin028]HOT06550.1 metallophosphoesterase [Methanotrichaceae archaeon]HQF16568.1 metallophosphoesterase [Methanotrichaceae archaeon]HQI91061.1 metallophosphoesterase [Methanotrichaceae archaeon]
MADTHLDGDLPPVLSGLASQAELILHGGDLASLQTYDDLKRLGDVRAVAGNSDHHQLRRLLPERTVLEVEDVSIGLIHQASHAEESPGASMLAREMDVDVLIFGHIHKPVLKEEGGRLLLCPGSPTRPRLSPPTVAEMDIEEGNVRVRFVPVGAPRCGYLRFAESLGRPD